MEPGEWRGAEKPQRKTAIRAPPLSRIGPRTHDRRGGALKPLDAEARPAASGCPVGDRLPLLVMRQCGASQHECGRISDAVIRGGRGHRAAAGPKMPPMIKTRRIRKASSGWAKGFERSFIAMTRMATASGQRALTKSLKPVLLKAAGNKRSAPPPGAGSWLPGIAMGLGGSRRFRLYRPPDVKFGERLPLLVMLHGCGQDANGFAASTRMNRIAQRERFLVLYPEQDRLANPQGCWNWFDTNNRRAYGEAALIMNAIDQACLLHPVDRDRVAIAGLSAGASMAALLVTRHPDRFKAVVMHSGIPPGTAHSTLSALGAMYGNRSTKALSAPAAATAIGVDWPPLLVIHGNVDHVVSPRNGEAAAQVWADAAGAASAASRSVKRGQRYPMTVTEFKRKPRGGRAANVATLVSVDGLGHAWSGGAASQAHGDIKGPDASRMVWAFAAKQFGG